MLYRDSMDRAIQVGDVCVKFSVVGSSSLSSTPVIVRELKPNGNIGVDVPDVKRVGEWPYQEDIPCFKKATVKESRYLTIVDVTEDQIRERYNIAPSGLSLVQRRRGWGSE